MSATALAPPERAGGFMKSFLPSGSALLALVLLTSCGEPDPQATRWELFTGEDVLRWRPSGIEREGASVLADGELCQAAGAPMTGIAFMDWTALGLPVADYAIEFEALREEGQDFFGTVTFPVRGTDTCASLVLGGWGGALVGISCIDGYDASENPTRGEQEIENGKWYRIRLEVRPDEIKAWMDKRLVVNINIAGRKIGLRAGDIEKCAPFGFATYATKGRVRGLVVSRLKPRV